MDQNALLLNKSKSEQINEPLNLQSQDKLSTAHKSFCDENQDQQLRKSFTNRSLIIQDLSKSQLLWHEGQETTNQKLKKILNILLPTVVAQFFTVFVEFLNVAFIGHLNDPAKIAGAGLGNMYVNIFCQSIILGLNGAIATLVSQSGGAKNYVKAGHYLNRGRFIIIISFVLIIPILLNCQNFLLLLKQDAKTAEYAQLYVTRFIPAMIFHSQFDATRQYLNALNKTQMVMIVTITTGFLHLVWTYILVIQMKWDIQGAAHATSITYFLNFLLMTLYCIWLGRDTDKMEGYSSQDNLDIKQSFFWFKKETFEDLGEYIKIGIPSCVMLCLEWWSFEVLALIAGYIDVMTIAAYVILINVSLVVTQISFGCHVTAIVCVGNSAGEGNYRKAKSYSKIIVLISFITMVLISIIVVSLRHTVTLLFTTEPTLSAAVVYGFLFMPLTFVTNGLGITLSGVIRGLGLQSQGYKINIFSYYFIGIPAAFIMGKTLEMGVIGLILGLALGGLCVSICDTVLLLWAVCWKEKCLQIYSKMNKTSESCTDEKKQMDYELDRL